MTFTTNFTNVVRQSDDPYYFATDPKKTTPFYNGVAGDAVRGTQEVDWQRRFIGPMGQVITPFASLRGDLFYLRAGPALRRSPEPRRRPASCRRSAFEWSWPLLITGRQYNPDHRAGRAGHRQTRRDRHRDAAEQRRAEPGVRFVQSFHPSTSSPASTASKAARGRTSACATTLIWRTAPRSTRPPANRSSSRARIPSRPTRSRPSAPIPGWRASSPTMSPAPTFDSGLGARLDARGRFDRSSFMLNRGELEATASFGSATASVGYLYSRETATRTTPSSVIRGSGDADARRELADFRLPHL